MKLSLYTFADEAFVPGVAALINSARRHGFSGKIHVGSAEPLSISKRPLEGVEFHALGLNGYWPGNRKAELPLKHPSDACVFLDNDIIVNDAPLFERLDLPYPPPFARIESGHRPMLSYAAARRSSL